MPINFCLSSFWCLSFGANFLGCTLVFEPVLSRHFDLSLMFLLDFTRLLKTVVLWSAEQPRSEIHVSGNNYLGIEQYSKWDIPASRDSLHKLVPFVQFKKREKHSWRSVTFKSNTPPWMFFTFIAQRIRYVCFNAFISCFNHLAGAHFNHCTVCLIHFQ